MKHGGTPPAVLPRQQPPDIAELKLERGELLGLVQDAVSMAGTFRVEAKTSLIDGKACPQKSLLALLTYCYALGIYGSRQIEEKLRTDEILRGIANECRPDHELLRKFRRAHREHIQQCLKRVYWFIWVKYRVEQASYVLTVDEHQPKPMRVRPSFSDKIQLESGECLSRAAFEDQMMSDAS